MSEPEASMSAEIISLTQEAINLANVAIYFDKEDNFVGAHEYYDKCLLNIDEVMSKLPHTSSQWMKLAEIRLGYDDRMEQLREMERDRNSMFGSSRNSSSALDELSAAQQTTSSPNRSSKAAQNRAKAKLQAQEDLNFVELSLEPFVYEPIPSSLPEIPFWQLRNIQRTIENGGFITEALFIPKKIWTQTDVKYLGMNVKTAAFTFLLNMLHHDIEPLVMRSDEQSLSSAEEVFTRVAEELVSLQNQLAKSFSYVKEVKHGYEVDLDSITSGGDAPPPRDSVSVSSSSTVAVTGSSPAVASSGSNKTWAKYMASVGKNMKKYAEVSMSRLAAAVPSRLSAEELSEYTALICELCDRLQILASWYRFSSGALRKLTTVQNPVFPQDMEVDSSREFVQQIHNEFPTPKAYGKLENLTQLLWTISLSVRDVVCEVLLRDIETLLDRYLAKTRKCYSRMHWDPDAGANE